MFQGREKEITSTFHRALYGQSREKTLEDLRILLPEEVIQSLSESFKKVGLEAVKLSEFQPAEAVARLVRDMGMDIVHATIEAVMDHDIQNDRS